jgi:hypothetical protein
MMRDKFLSIPGAGTFTFDEFTTLLKEHPTDWIKHFRPSANKPKSIPSQLQGWNAIQAEYEQYKAESKTPPMSFDRWLKENYEAPKKNKSSL